MRPVQPARFKRMVAATRAKPGAKTAYDPLRASGDVGRISAQRLRDRVDRLAVEQHAEVRQILVVEPRNRGLERVALEPAQGFVPVPDAAHSGQESEDGRRLVDHAVRLSGGPAPGLISRNVPMA
jgi:hypothetical protein